MKGSQDARRVQAHINDGAHATQPWPSLFRAPEPCDHVIQLHTDEAFLTRAISEFVGTGLVQAEGAVVIATPEHAAAVTRVLRGRMDVAAIEARTRLVILDAQATLDQFMVDGRPDHDRFFAIAGAVLDRVTAPGYPQMRLFGEMVDLLWDHNLPATIELEELWNEVLAARRVSLLCAYQIDSFDRHAHRGVLRHLSRTHSHLVPVEDYGRFAPVMPAAQAALLALRDVRRDLPDDVLARARRHSLRA